MSSNAQRFAAAVLAAFKAAGHYTDQEVGDAGGPSTTTLTKLRKVADEGASMPPPRSDTLKKIDKAADWEPGSARELWQFGTSPKLSKPSNLHEVLGLEPPSPEEMRRQRRAARRGSGFEGWVESLADRILELEERLDSLEDSLRESGGEAHDFRAAANQEPAPSPAEQLGTQSDYDIAAHDEEHTIAEEQEGDEFP